MLARTLFLTAHPREDYMKGIWNTGHQKIPWILG